MNSPPANSNPSIVVVTVANLPTARTGKNQ